MNRAEFPLKNHELDQLRKAFGIIPEDIEGQPFCDVVRRKTLERRRVTLIRKDSAAVTCSGSYDLWQMCRFRAVNGDLIPLGWALRSKVTGEYCIFCEVW